MRVTAVGNIDMNVVGKIINRGLVRNGRLTRFVFVIPDVPGSLASIINILADNNVNIVEIGKTFLSYFLLFSLFFLFVFDVLIEKDSWYTG